MRGGGAPAVVAGARPAFAQKVEELLEASLSKAVLGVEDDAGHRVAQRFELYIRGIELANGYHELLDPVEQRRRFGQANRDREARGRPPLPLDESLIAALGGGFPACAGVALGFDRLMMVVTGAEDIGEVRMLSGD